MEISVLRFDILCCFVLFLSVLFAETAATDVQVDYDYENYKILQLKKRFSINCTIVDAPQASIKWTKDGKELNPKDGYSTVDKPPSFLVVVEKPTDEHTGNYTCQAYHNTTLLKTKEIIVVSQPTASMNADTIVVEEEKLTLDCQPTGKPTPQVTWIIAGNIVLNGSSADSSHIQQLPSNDVPNGKLRINSAMMSDRGEYKCIVSNIVTTNMNGTEASAVTLVRVKDKLAALWPFLGICAEVFVLCAIILIYEKKRNKAELEESDTDNSPEQKNTPDHGKDSVRQRK
ncbi:basigin [Anabrus simplex]|uniref:basigin n=1 Tax=Anabrus simplex TaxID=316456 RepID=UPI0034DCECAD